MENVILYAMWKPAITITWIVALMEVVAHKNILIMKFVMIVFILANSAQLKHPADLVKFQLALENCFCLMEQIVLSLMIVLMGILRWVSIAKFVILVAKLAQVQLQHALVVNLVYIYTMVLVCLLVLA